MNLITHQTCPHHSCSLWHAFRWYRGQNNLPYNLSGTDHQWPSTHLLLEFLLAPQLVKNSMNGSSIIILFFFHKSVHQPWSSSFPLYFSPVLILKLLKCPGFVASLICLRLFSTLVFFPVSAYILLIYINTRFLISAYIYLHYFSSFILNNSLNFR